MKVTIIGSGTAVPETGRSQSSLLIKGGVENIILDAGSGSLKGAVAAGVDPRLVDSILISHLHVDHVGELPAWLFAFRNPEFKRDGPLNIGGGPGLKEHLESLMRVYGNQIIPDVEVAVFDLLREDLPSVEFDVKALPVKHSTGSVGFRITERKRGTIVAYSGDAEESSDLIELGRDADLFVIECSFPDSSPKTGHLHPQSALRVAAASRCKKAVLTHFYPGWDPERAVALSIGAYKDDIPDITVAEDGLTIDLEGD